MPRSDDDACTAAAQSWQSGSDFEELSDDCRSKDTFHDLESRIANPRGVSFMDEIALQAPLWFLVRSDGTLQLSCASGGTIDFDPSSETLITLTGIGAPVECPGAATDPNAFDFMLE